MLDLWTEAVRSIEPLVKPAHRDLWLRPIECLAIDDGVRVRTLAVVKARGMGHSNQTHEVVISKSGVEVNHRAISRQAR